MENLNYIVNVEGVVYHEGRYLMITRSAHEPQDPRALAMPGGKVEGAGELQNVLEETVRREILEETGVEVCEEMEYLESKSFVMGDGTPVVDVVFFCTYQTGEPHITDSVEVAAVQWMTADEILAHTSTPQWTRQSIELAEALLKSRVAKGDV